MAIWYVQIVFERGSVEVAFGKKQNQSTSEWRTTSVGNVELESGEIISLPNAPTLELQVLCL
jgi:hypothetical protein